MECTGAFPNSKQDYAGTIQERSRGAELTPAPAVVFRRTPWFLVGVLSVIVVGLMIAIIARNPVVKDLEAAGVVRRTPTSVQIATIRWASAAQVTTSKSWIVPFVYYLEDHADAVVSSGSWQDALPIVVETTEFTSPTTEFDLTISTEPGISVCGYAYRICRDNGLPSLLSVTTKSNDSMGGQCAVVSVCDCEAGDSLSLLLLVCSSKELPADASQLVRSIKLSARMTTD